MHHEHKWYWHTWYFSLTSMMQFLLQFINSNLSSENCYKKPFPKNSTVLYLLSHEERQNNVFIANLRRGYTVKYFFQTISWNTVFTFNLISRNSYEICQKKTSANYYKKKSHIPMLATSPCCGHWLICFSWKVYFHRRLFF